MHETTAAHNGVWGVEIRHRKTFPGGRKEEKTIKKEDGTMGEDDAAKLEGVPAVVGVTKKLTMNLGNFESATVSVHLSMPCEPKKDGINEMYEKVSKWVDARVETERLAIRQAASSGS